MSHAVDTFGNRSPPSPDRRRGRLSQVRNLTRTGSSQGLVGAETDELEGFFARRTLAELREAGSERGGWLGRKLPEQQLDQFHLARSDAVASQGVDEVAEPCVERAAYAYGQVGERFVGKSWRPVVGWRPLARGCR